MKINAKKIISWNLIILIIATTIIYGLIPVSVMALSAGGLQTTIASIIISLMLECGAAPVNNVWLQTLNTSYGVESTIGTIQDCVNSGLLTQSGSTLIDTGLSAAIEAESAYTELGLADIFATSADDVAGGVLAASGGTNLPNTAINVGTTGTIGAFAGAVAIGAGLGVLANKIYNYASDFIKYGLPMTPDNINGIAKNIPEGYDRCSFDLAKWGATTMSEFYFTTGSVYDAYYVDNNNHEGLLYATEGTSIKRIVYYNKTLQNEQDRNIGKYSAYPGFVYGSGNWTFSGTNYKAFPDRASAYAYFENIRNGDIPDITVNSPDLIGKEGNFKNDERPQNIVPDGYDMTPVDMNDYLNYADNANNNTDNGNIGEDIQGSEFDNLIDNLLVEPSIIPDQGVTDPEVPERPIIPDQPSVPDKDPITADQQSDVLEGITTPDLRSVFPFCIPFDLYNIFGVLKYEGREAPVIVWNFEILGNSYPVIIDLSPYEDVAALLRLLELLAFIVGLAVATRKLIGAGG